MDMHEREDCNCGNLNRGAAEKPLMLSKETQTTDNEIGRLEEKLIKMSAKCSSLEVQADILTREKEHILEFDP